MYILYIYWNPINKFIIYHNIYIHIYSLFFIIAFYYGLFIIKKIFIIEKLNQYYIDKLFIYIILSIFIGARLGHIFFYDFFYFKNNIIEAFLPIKYNYKIISSNIFNKYEFIGYQGLSSHGAAIGLIIAIYLYSKNIIKKSFLWLSDRLSIPIALGCSLVRIGNFFNSEIIGKPSSLPWAIIFVQNEYGQYIPRHPTQLYESIGYIIIYIILYILYYNTNKKKYIGYISSIFLIGMSSMRIFIEYFKEPQGIEIINIKYLNTGQILSIPFLIIGILIFKKIKKNIL